MPKRNASLLLRINDCIASINQTTKEIQAGQIDYTNIIQRHTINGFEGDIVIKSLWTNLPRPHQQSQMVYSASISDIFLYTKFRRHGLAKALLNTLTMKIVVPVWIAAVENTHFSKYLEDAGWIRMSTLFTNPEIKKMYAQCWIQPNYFYKTYQPLPSPSTVNYARLQAKRFMSYAKPL